MTTIAVDVRLPEPAVSDNLVGDARLAVLLAPPVYRCEQCGKPMGAERFLGPVCGACCRANHRRVVGR